MAQTSGRKVVVVTGGSAGVGRATVREFAKAGYDVAILARGQAGIDGAAVDVQEAGGRAGAELRATGSNVTIGTVTLPGVNTTQFNWNLTRMPEHPMPVPPIVQPEVCARAIRFCAEHPRRNMWVGISTAYTVLGNRIAQRWPSTGTSARPG